jgi:hypothetical protein
MFHKQEESIKVRKIRDGRVKEVVREAGTMGRRLAYLNIEER